MLNFGEPCWTAENRSSLSCSGFLVVKTKAATPPPAPRPPKNAIRNVVKLLWWWWCRVLTQHCYKLRYLNLRGCINITDTAIASIAINSTKLK